MADAQSPLPGLFITGTDTGVGKTFVTAAIAGILAEEGLKVGVIKPVATGLSDRFSPEADAVLLLQSAGWPLMNEYLNLANPLVFQAAAAPTVAARAEARRLDWAELTGCVQQSIWGWTDLGVDCILVEGVGGLNCPLAEGNKTVLSLVETLDWPTLVVARKGLGTLNHSINTINLLKSGPTRLAGVILNHVPGDDPAGIPELTAAEELSGHVAPVPILHVVRNETTLAELRNQLKCLDWPGRLGRPRWFIV